MIFSYRKFGLISSLFLIFLSNAVGQTDLNRNKLNALILSEDFVKARAELDAQLEYIEQGQYYDSLYHYPYYSGKIYLGLDNSETAVNKATELVNYTISKTNNPKTQYKTWLDLANLFDDLGDNKRSLDVTQKALDIALSYEETTPDEIGKIRYNLGATQLSLGNISAAKENFLMALKDYEASGATPKSQLSDGYNAAGAVMWMSSKLDSAKIYYALAEQTIAEAPGKRLENLYLATVIKANRSLLSYSQNNLSEAVQIQNEVIGNYQSVIDSLKNESIVSQSKRYQLRALKNLSVFYNEQGNLKKANEVLYYAYQKEKQILEPRDLQLIASQVQIAQSHLSLKEFKAARDVLLGALQQTEHYNQDAPYWRATTYHALAEAQLGLGGDNKHTKEYFTKAEALFKAALGDEYDTEFLGFLRNKASFLAAEGYYEEAIKTAMDGKNYLEAQNTGFSIPQLKTMITLGEIQQASGEYQQANQWYAEVEELIGNALASSANAADSLQYVFYKPQLILSKVKLVYTQTENKDNDFLKNQLDKLEEATEILELKKSTIFKKEDISNLLEQYQQIAEFAKKLALERYAITGDKRDLNRLLELHESGIYNRIRARLNLKNDIAFARVPDSIKQKEQTLKNQISKVLGNEGNVGDFLSAETAWQLFLNQLRQEYPNYYRLRYEKITADLDNLQQDIAQDVTVVRYVFIEDRLIAVVLSATDAQLIDLGAEGWRSLLLSPDNFYDSNSEFMKYSVALYESLWAPLAEQVTTERVLIIPDRELFNLNFEILAPNFNAQYSEMLEESLLAKHTLSYNYSLLLISPEANSVDFKQDFIGFAPGFSEEMKQQYRQAAVDSINRDERYLRLLPQPAISELTKTYSRKFGGDLFLNGEASKAAFVNSADRHKIIQIGTHAESDNIAPILSRLIFAKTPDASDNSLYTYEIYNLELNTNLAILTACETGKPQYQAGEGMISLAHAFNYAGSKSILTSLRKIDEKSTTQIIGLFYDNLAKGQAKDLALKNAKRSYLSKAPARLTSPDYWAGLVLLGDTSPIIIESKGLGWFWYAGFGLVFLAFYLWRRRRVTT